MVIGWGACTATGCAARAAWPACQSGRRRRNLTRAASVVARAAAPAGRPAGSLGPGQAAAGQAASGQGCRLGWQSGRDGAQPWPCPDTEAGHASVRAVREPLGARADVRRGHSAAAGGPAQPRPGPGSGRGSDWQCSAAPTGPAGGGSDRPSPGQAPAAAPTGTRASRTGLAGARGATVPASHSEP